MTTLSAPSHPAFKYPFPFVVGLAACAWTYWSDLHSGREKPLWIYILVALMLSVMIVFTFRRGPWSKADAVEYSGDALFVKRFRTSETISLDQLKSVVWEDRLVRLEFSTPNSFGSSIDFYAKTDSPEVTAMLEVIAARARSHSGRNAA